jgi:hypothetical protein
VVSPGRVVVVTVGLTLTGVVLGGAAAGIALAILMLLHGKPHALFDPFFWIGGGIVGGVLGAVVAPVMSWLLLRPVSLGKALLQTMVGAIAGGVIGAIMLPADFMAPLWGAFGGYTAAAVRLRFKAQPPGRAIPTTVPGSRRSPVQFPR